MVIFQVFDMCFDLNGSRLMSFFIRALQRWCSNHRIMTSSQRTWKKSSFKETEYLGQLTSFYDYIQQRRRIYQEQHSTIYRKNADLQVTLYAKEYLFWNGSNQINYYLIFCLIFFCFFLFYPYKYYVCQCIAFVIQKRTRRKRKYYFLLSLITAYFIFKKICWYEFNGSTSRKIETLLAMAISTNFDN